MQFPFQAACFAITPSLAEKRRLGSAYGVPWWILQLNLPTSRAKYAREMERPTIVSGLQKNQDQKAADRSVRATSIYRTQHLFGEEVVEGFYGFEFVVADIEDGVELGDVEDIVNFLGEVEEFEFASGVANGGEAADEFTHAG